MEKKAIIERVRAIHKTALLYGGWGIGKTHFVKNELFKDLESDSNVVYVDARLFDSNQDVYDYVSQHILQFKNFKNTIIDSAKQIAELGYNVAAFFANSMFKTNMPFIKNDAKKVTVNDAISKANNKPIYLLVDELDRVTPDTIIKTLNFVNGISIVDDKIKILVIGNKHEINSILKYRFGYTDENDFLHKYFEDEIDIDVIAKSAVFSIIWHDFNDLFDALWEEVTKANISARVVERKLKELTKIKNKYDSIFSDDVYKIIFLKSLGIPLQLNENVLHTPNGNFKLEFSLTNNEQKLNLIDKNRYFFSSKKIVTCIEDLNENYDLSNFGEWVKNWRLLR